MKKIISSYFVNPIIVVVIIITVVMIMSSSLRPVLLQIAQQALENISKRVTVVTTPAPVIVERLQALNRMETTRQTSRQIVEAESNSTLFPDFLTKDKLQMMVQTEIIAGVDLSRMSESDIQVDTNTVTITLPQPELFSVRIDDNNSQVYVRERGLFMFHPDKDLERQARLQAQFNARQAASTVEVMAAARTNAESNLRNLLQNLGFSNIDFKWASASLYATNNH